ncbi:hypothetical protein CTheo_521 [Ceratobasidium theobromae]|uniref:Effector protein n=1 Tax=Ceratobasidium theobromae TaxID=1582974 RepID=A0A5N5QWD0_9AGAM|nr:hypothetical protein CTheo_521 [Ceratobasidium theobromae]
MRTPASFALVALMAVGITAAPIRVNHRSSVRAATHTYHSDAPGANCQLHDQGMVNFVGGVEDTSVKKVQALKLDVDGRMKDLNSKIMPDQAPGPEKDGHPQSNENEGGSEPYQSPSQPNSESCNHEYCPNSSHNHNKGEPVVAATVQTNPGDEEEGVDAIRQAGMSTAESTHGALHHSSDALGDAIKAKTSLALDDLHHNKDQATDDAREIGKDSHVEAKVDVEPNHDNVEDVGTSFRPSLSVVHESSEDTKELVEDFGRGAVAVSDGPTREPNADHGGSIAARPYGGSPSASVAVTRRLTRS